MIHLVDLGNTRLKVATLTADSFNEVRECVHRGRPLGESLSELLPALAPSDRLLVASVAPPEQREALYAWNLQHGGARVAWLAAQAHAFGVNNAYSEPERLGVDRWLALVAARSLTAGPVCVVDCGSALTVDAMDGAGCHRGGLILPGLAAAARALGESAPALASVSGGRIVELADNTADAVASGPLLAAAALVARVVGRLRAGIQSEPACLVSGGDAALLLPWLEVAHRHVPNLVLRGLARVAREKER